MTDDLDGEEELDDRTRDTTTRGDVDTDNAGIADLILVK